MQHPPGTLPRKHKQSSLPANEEYAQACSSCTATNYSGSYSPATKESQFLPVRASPTNSKASSDCPVSPVKLASQQRQGKSETCCPQPRGTPGAPLRSSISTTARVREHPQEPFAELRTRQETWTVLFLAPCLHQI